MKTLHNKVNGDVLRAKLAASDQKRITLSFYKYALLGNPSLFRDHFYILLSKLDVLGRIYVSNEGVNAQVSVPESNFDSFKSALNTILFLENVRLNIAIEDDGKSFFKLIIKVRNKIVADGLDDAAFDVTDRGVHLNAVEFNKISDDPDTIIVDMRNHYESEVGHFQNAITPDVETFREALPIVENLLEGQEDKNIIMYCTGGIRCEKASAYYKHRGFKKVYQLDGGIIEYARQVRNQNLENKFLGKNFVFDERLGERIGEEIIAKCHQCGNACDQHVNCSNDACHILFIQCDSCAEQYEDCCSVKCRDFRKLPDSEKEAIRHTIQFNGTSFGKGRYKASKKDEGLCLD